MLVELEEAVSIGSDFTIPGSGLHPEVRRGRGGVWLVWWGREGNRAVRGVVLHGGRGPAHRFVRGSAHRFVRGSAHRFVRG